MEKLIGALSDLRGISGFEYRIADKIEELIAPYADEVRKDALGNIIAVKRCGKKNAKKIMIEAHTDEIGLMVKDVDKHGFVTFVPVGGIDKRILPASEVIIHGKRDIKGVIGAKPPHLQNPGEASKTSEIEDMAIDTGLDCEEIKKYVSVGDSITFSQSVGKLAGGQFSGKTLDDRAGIAAVITAMKKLMKIKTEADVFAVAAVQEEVGLRGAKTAAYGVEPDIAICVDVCHAITPDNSSEAFESGKGVVLSVGLNIHPKLFKRLKDVAKSRHLDIQLDADGGDTGTDAWAVQISRCGVPTALLSIPLKYMHTPVETLSISDVEGAAELLCAFIENLDGNTEEWLCL